MAHLVRDRLPLVLADALQRSILDKGMGSGDQLPTEAELMAEYGVSRTVVREAAAILSARGLVEVRPRRGMTVREPDPAILSEQLAVLLLSSHIEPGQLYEVRAILEGAIASIAARERTEEDLAELDACLAEEEAVRDDWDRALAMDIRFHELLARSTHNPFFVLVTSPVSSLLRRLYVDQPKYLALQDVILDEHQAIVAAIRAMDSAEATNAILRHLGRVAQYIGEGESKARRASGKVKQRG